MKVSYLMLEPAFPPLPKHETCEAKNVIVRDCD